MLVFRPLWTDDDKHRPSQKQQYLTDIIIFNLEREEAVL